MPNIMLTYRCNLQCPYCFANEFVNKESTDITLEGFSKAIDFLTKDGPTYIGLIGGEPTLHRNLKDILRMIINNSKIQECTIYTNGLKMDKYINELSTPKFRLLINCNSPEIIGTSRYSHIVDNLDIMFRDHYMESRMNLGFNFYSDDIDYSFIIDLLRRYDLHRVRLSLTVPDFEKCEKTGSMEYFRKRKDGLYKLLHEFDDNAIVPYYDCNKPPFCLWNKEEKEWIEGYVGKYGVSESNLVGNQSLCYPVIDILPTLEAVRCFGMSSFEKVKIEDFQCLTDIASYFLNRIDCEAYHIADCKDCEECYYRKTRHCTAGCIGFKAHTIKRINGFAEIQ